MAYVFSGINNQLEDEKANIFGNQPGMGQQAGQPAGGGEMKTSTEGELGGASQGGGSSAPKQSIMPTQSTQRMQASINKAAAKAKTPGAVTKIGQDLGTAKQNVQAEANKYSEAAKAKSFNLDQSALEDAASGKQEALGQVGGRLAQQGIGTVEQFKPETQYELQSVQDIQTDPGIKEMYKREVGPQYSRGESAFDSMLLQRNPEFLKIRNQLQQEQQQLKSDVEKDRDLRSQEAQKVQEERFAADTKDIRNRLTGMSDAEIAKAQARAEEINKRRAGLDVKGIAAAKEQEAARKLAEEMGAAGQTSFSGRAAKYLMDSGLLNEFDEGQYVKGGGNVDWKSTIEQPEVERFNRIRGLLGDTNYAQVGKGVGEDVVVDPQMREAMKNLALTRRQKVEDDLRGTRSQWEQDLKGKVEGAKKGRADALAAQREGLASKIRSSIKSKDPGEQRDLMESVYNKIMGADLGAYSNLNEDISWRDLIDSGMASHFSNIQAELGEDNPYAAGRGSAARLDQDRMLAALFPEAPAEARKGLLEKLGDETYDQVQAWDNFQQQMGEERYGAATKNLLNAYRDEVKRPAIGKGLINAPNWSNPGTWG